MHWMLERTDIRVADHYGYLLKSEGDAYAEKIRHWSNSKKDAVGNLALRLMKKRPYDVENRYSIKARTASQNALYAHDAQLNANLAARGLVGDEETVGAALDVRAYYEDYVVRHYRCANSLLDGLSERERADVYATARASYLALTDAQWWSDHADAFRDPANVEKDWFERVAAARLVPPKKRVNGVKPAPRDVLYSRAKCGCLKADKCRCATAQRNARLTAARAEAKARSNEFALLPVDYPRAKGLKRLRYNALAELLSESFVADCVYEALKAKKCDSLLDGRRVVKPLIEAEIAKFVRRVDFDKLRDDCASYGAQCGAIANYSRVYQRARDSVKQAIASL